MFHGLERLKVLNLEGNRISHIAADAFLSNTKIRSLNLAGNRLTFLSGGWFRSYFPFTMVVSGNAIATIALEGRALPFRYIPLDDPPRCTCANDWLYEHQGNTLKLKQQFIGKIRVPLETGCLASALNPNPPAPVSPRLLPCPAPLVEIVSVKGNAAYKYKAVGDVYWEQLPVVSCAFPNGLQNAVSFTYDTNTTTHDILPTGNLTVRVMTDLKAEGWLKCMGFYDLLKESGKDSLCSNYMGKSRFTLWLETAEPLAFGNTTCTVSSETGSHNAVFMASKRAHSGLTIPQATELSLTNTAPSSTIINTTLPLTSIGPTPLYTGASDDAYEDLKWYIVSAVIEIVPYGLAKLSAAYAGRARAQTHPVPSRPYSTERPRETPNREGAVLAAYGPNGRDKSGKKCYQHPSILPNPGATKSSAYQQNASAAQRSRNSPALAPCYNSPALATDQNRTLSNTYDQRDPREAAKGSRKAPCYNSPALATDQNRTLPNTYDHRDAREAAKGSRKAPCYNSPALATDQERTLSTTYDQHGHSEAVCNSAESPVAQSYQPATLPNSESGTQSAIYDDRGRGNAATGRGISYICPSPAASAERSPAAAYSQNDRREAINDTLDAPETNSYEPTSARCQIQ
uniref:LRRCT domain-containing protein n=1 Tax=Branchiostoma floridae TaxID=7739 RepID=C3YNJ9_BRAFL|eukprot:XP_002602293.1 hypothetical protein BRAFLDRAFT_76985 [Branchiostoma floridae]